MIIKDYLLSKYPGKVFFPKSKKDLKGRKSMVYILALDNQAIAVGHGGEKRAEVIFDNLDYSSRHVKAMHIRVHNLYSDPDKYERFVIDCDDRDEAKKIEKDLHVTIGGNKLKIPDDYRDKLLQEIKDDPVSSMVLRMALSSYYDGVADLKKWYKHKVIDEKTWLIISKILKLEQKTPE